MELSRRNFLAGAGAAGMLGVMGLAGCAPETKATASAGAAEGELSATGAVATRPDYYMCDEDWLGEAPEVAADAITQTSDFDVVVVGGGHAGTQAALAAAQAGAKVAVCLLYTSPSPRDS